MPSIPDSSLESGFDDEPAVTGSEDSPIRGSKKTSVSRRTKLYSSSKPWWRPRSTFGRVVLGTCVVLVLGVFGTVVMVTRNFLLRDGRFRIAGASSIQTAGLTEVSRAEVLPIFGEDIGRNIFFVPLAERRKHLEAIPWIKQATVMRFLPDRISISVQERTPVVYVRQGQSIELADADGVILSMPPAMLAQHHYSFPVVTGINAGDTPADRKARMTLYQRFITELDQNHQHLTSEVSEIDLSDPEDLRATMPEQGSDILAHFGEDQFLHKLQTYHAHIADWRQRYPKLIGVDLRYSGEVPLEMATDNEATAAATLKPVSAGQVSAKPVSLQPTMPVTDSVNREDTAKVSTERIAAARTKANVRKTTTSEKQNAAKARAKAIHPRATQLKADGRKKAHTKQKPAHPKPTHPAATSGHTNAPAGRPTGAKQSE